MFQCVPYEPTPGLCHEPSAELTALSDPHLYFIVILSLFVVKSNILCSKTDISKTVWINAYYQHAKCTQSICSIHQTICEMYVILESDMI